MAKRFPRCSLPDLALEIFLDARAAACRGIEDAAAALVLPCFTDANMTEAVLQRHPLVRGANGLVCTYTKESEQAWRTMLRELFCAGGKAVGGASLPRSYHDIDKYIYLVCRDCCRRGHVRACEFIGSVLAHPCIPLAGLGIVAQLTAHPVHCLASQINFARWRAMLLSLIHI